MWNFGNVFTEIVTIEGEIAVDEAELAAGQDVPIPATIQIGSVQGKPVYLKGALTTTKPS